MRKRIMNTGALLVARSIDYLSQTKKSIEDNLDMALIVFQENSESNFKDAGGEEIFPLKEINQNGTSLSYDLTQDYGTYQNMRNAVRLGVGNYFHDEDEVDYFELSLV